MFGERLKSALQNADITQIKLSQELGLSQQAINRWCNNITEPDNKMIVNVAKCLNVSTDYILGNDVKINKSEEEIKEKEALKKLLVKNNYMKENEELTDKEIERLMDFIKINKDYIKSK